MNALKRYRKYFTTLTLCFFLLAPMVVFAAEICTPEENPATNKFISKTFSCNTATGITYRFTQCVDQILKNVSDTAFDSVLQGMSKAVGAVLTIFVAATGMKMVLGGVRNIKGEALTTIIKLAVVASFAWNTGAIAGQSGLKAAYDLVQGINTGLVHLVSGTIIGGGPCSAGGEQNLWKRVDCTMLVFIGKEAPLYSSQTIDMNGDGTIQPTEQNVQVPVIARGDKDLNCDGEILGFGQLNQKGEPTPFNEHNAVLEDARLFEFSLSQLFTAHGIFILFLLIAAALMLLIAFGRALQVYVISMVAITFLFLLGPIFIPLILFQRTRQMFLTWVAMIMGYIIQPAMLMAFLVFLLASFNVALHGDPVSGAPGLKQSLDLMGTKMDENQCTRKILVWSQNAIKGSDSDTPIPDFKATIRNLIEEVNAVTAPVTPVDYKDLSVLMVHLIACCVLLYVMMVLLGNVADFVGSLSTGAGGNLARFGGGMQQLGGAVRDAVKAGS